MLTWQRFFLNNHTQNVVEKLVPNPFLKNQNWAYLWINSLKFYTVYLYRMPSWGYRNILKLSCRPLAFNSYKAFSKNKKRSGASLSTSFCAWFWAIYGLKLLTGCDAINFETNFVFLIKPLFLHDQKVKTKI